MKISFQVKKMSGRCTEDRWPNINRVDEAKRVLMATKDAKLQHFVRGQSPIIFYDTMKIREVLE